MNDAGNWREEHQLDDTTLRQRSTPADIAAMRVDFAAWLRQLERRKRAAAKLLASGAATCEAAAQLRLSPARISQLRRELKTDWARFQGELLEVTA